MKIRKFLSAFKKKLFLFYITHKNKKTFNEIERYCMFVGYPRSGHSLIGSLLNAHPEIVISHELDALNYIQQADRNELYANILYKDYIFGKKNREWCGYSYFVPNSSQGKFESLKVIGDKKGAGTALHLYEKNEILQELQHLIKIPLYIIHVMRNPYDMISRHSLALGKSIDESILQYCKNFAAVGKHYGVFNWIDLYHEDFVSTPKEQMKRLLQFLDVNYTSPFLDNVQSVLFSSPKRSRDQVKWSPKNIEFVAQEISKYEYFSRYNFTN